ncbi:MAG: GNAT family N-acetyltransferase [Candidatus Cloacimonetes bacterium]|nr:GNAT family N-acetyltransferase [Candidatus Cloacimonadota bacterium]
MAIEIIAVNNSKLLKEFIMLPFELYKNNANWVAPLISEQKKFFNPEKNPFYEHSEAQLFIAYHNNKPVGRISAHTNTRHNSTFNDKLGFFGFFECIDDKEVAHSLLNKAAEWNLSKGRDSMRGPMNFSLHNECGTLIDGFDTPPFVMMTHNHAYYPKLLDSYGLHKAMDIFAYMVAPEKTPERLEKFVQMVQKRYNYTVRCLSKNKNEMKKDLQTVMKLYGEAWKNNWGAVEMSDKEFDSIVEELLPIADRNLVFIAEVDGKPVGFSVALPNYNIVLKKMKGRLFPLGLFKALYYKNKIDAVRVITLGVIKEYQKKGIESVMIYHTFKNGYNSGYNRAEISWILEDNVEMNNLANRLDANLYKKYRIYDKIL